ncbi:MAG: hypothetical protein LBE18_06885 [Planctomycetaceae bacterium]|jgi:hypothetical protein|nr:hypothetical protein [Planctomycetaceae bacterium]
MTDKKEIVYQICYDDHCPSIYDLRDDPAWGLSEEVRQLISAVLEDDDSSEYLFEGDGCWHGNAHGSFEIIQVPYIWSDSKDQRSSYEMYVCSGCGIVRYPNPRQLDFACPDDAAFLIKRWKSKEPCFLADELLLLDSDYPMFTNKYTNTRRLGDIYFNFSDEYRKQRSFSVFRTDYFDGTFYSSEKDCSYDALCNRLIKDIEEILRCENGIEASLLPGDKFNELFWIDPIFIKQREIFIEFCGMNLEKLDLALILNSRLTERFRQSNLSGLEFQPLRMKNRFFPDYKEQFVAVTMSSIEDRVSFVDDPCYTEKHCEVCNCTSYRDPTPQDPNFQDWIRYKDKNKSYRKKNILPKQYVPDFPWFYTSVYQGILIKPEVMALLHDVDLSFAKIKEIEIV